MQACMHAGMYKDKHSTKSFKTINQQYVRVCMHVCITQPNPSRQINQPNLKNTTKTINYSMTYRMCSLATECVF